MSIASISNAPPFAFYKGFDLYPLVYKNQPVQTWPRVKPDGRFNASIVICRTGYRPGSEHTRVFRLENTLWENIGTARRGAVQFGEDIINGLVAGESVVSL
ncbi:hypothetical protein SGO26_28005 [Cupriavidus metallidurans]|uniref:hypothetical protein n=1 Tax=Cupriavidus TaxID=106589 RepID=UPI00055DF34A|nr:MULTISPECIES: hypothetical protein [Cupriavidus]GMG92448.1 hypothetical protein Cmtc_36680 [Cupriavidus sp. TKC]HBD33226.1 hypothetical protein [Cupriavidus sp.]HBO77862.1 hypothetical protein [Cupriavidus sp.]